MVGEHSHGQKEKWKKEDVYILHWFKQALPQG
jgi:hypothetical protein